MQSMCYKYTSNLTRLIENQNHCNDNFWRWFSKSSLFIGRMILISFKFDSPGQYIRPLTNIMRTLLVSHRYGLATPGLVTMNYRTHCDATRWWWGNDSGILIRHHMTAPGQISGENSRMTLTLVRCLKRQSNYIQFLFC